MNTDNIQIQYITSKEGLRLALIDALSELNLIQFEAKQTKAPATRKEACKYLKISLPTLGKLIKSNEIKSFSIGASVRIRWEELENYLNLKNAPTNKKG